MKAMILAAGLGSRLKQYTKDRPKALVELNGRPVLAYIIENLLAAGVNDFVLNLHYLPEQIKDFIADQNYPAKFAYSEEPELLDTGGALGQAKSLLTDADYFILHNCDIYTDVSMESLVKTHLENKNQVTVAVSKQQSDRHLWFNQSGGFVGCENKLTSYRQLVTEDAVDSLVPWDYNCISVINREVLDYAAKLPDKFTLFELYFEVVKAGGQVGYHDIKDAYWVDIGTPEDLAQAASQLAG